jgi:Tol biopolymer transport system component
MLTTLTTQPSLSRDGKKLAFVLVYDPNPGKNALGNQGIKVVNMADMMIPEPDLRKPTPGLEKGISPSWSPDGQWLAYMSNDMRDPGIYIVKSDLSEKRLVYAPIATQQIHPVPVGWSPDSKWLTFAVSDGTIYIVDINGEQLTPLTGAGAHSSPVWSH